MTQEMCSSYSCMSSVINVGNINALVQGDLKYPSTSIMNLPVGFRFLPTDNELIVHYLKRKVDNQPLPYNNIHTVNLYELRPEDLCDILGGSEGNEWYLFCPRKRRSSGGTRADRTTPYGHWKATSGDRAVKHNGEEVGYRKTLVYYKGKSPSAQKTDWIMHEYRLKDQSPAPIHAPENINRLSDDIVLCRIHNHNKSCRSNNDGARNGETQLNQPIFRVVEGDHQQSFSATSEESQSNSFPTPLGMQLLEPDEVLFPGNHCATQGYCDQYSSLSGDLFDDFDEIMDKGMEVLSEVMNMEF